ncbi:MAG: hypothetical protein M3548_21660 [Actinomycetota bacterium]|nr:hypothetical protein [Actinomycetota bacterium]
MYEAQFLTTEQVDHLAGDSQVDVLAGRPFERARADGPATRAGDAIMVADTETSGFGTDSEQAGEPSPATVCYQVLCRRRFRLGDVGAPQGVQDQLTFA